MSSKSVLEDLTLFVKEASLLTTNNFDIKEKGEYGDLVTNLDVEVEELLIQKLKGKYPDFDIVSEETNSSKEIKENCFIIDPIDGTINFANKLPLWGIQIACVVNYETISAVIYLPQMNELYAADSEGAYLNNNRITINEVPIKNTLYSIDGTNNLPIMQKMRPHSSGRRNLGAVCVSMAFLSCGRLHGALFRSDKPWDYAPGLFIAKKAGAVICDEPGFHGAAMNAEFLNILKKANEES